MNYFVDRSFMQLNGGKSLLNFILQNSRREDVKIYISVNALETIANQFDKYNDLLNTIYIREQKGDIIIAFPDEFSTAELDLQRFGPDLREFYLVEMHCAPDDMIYITANLANYYRANLIVGNDSIQYIPF